MPWNQRYESSSRPRDATNLRESPRLFETPGGTSATKRGRGGTRWGERATKNAPVGIRSNDLGEISSDIFNLRGLRPGCRGLDSEIPPKSTSARDFGPCCFTGYAMATFLGRPPFRPLAREAATLATVRDRPPSAPSSRAIQPFEPNTPSVAPAHRDRRPGGASAGRGRPG